MDYDPRMTKLLDGLKSLVDGFEPGVYRNGPMRIRFQQPDPNREAPWEVSVEAGYDQYYGGRITIISSKTGKSLHVYRDGVEI